MHALEEISAAFGTTFASAIQHAVAIEVEKVAKPLREELELLRQLSDIHVNTSEACRILDCSRGWIEKERSRPGTLISVSYLDSKPTYSRASLLAYQASRTPKLHATNRRKKMPVDSPTTAW